MRLILTWGTHDPEKTLEDAERPPLRKADGHSPFYTQVLEPTS